MADANQLMYDAVDLAMKQYPWLRRFGRIALTQGEGPFQSESYMPDAADNPKPGNYTVEMRSARVKNNRKSWPGLIAREGIDWLARSDPNYQNIAQSFVSTLTPEQIANSQQRFQREGGKGSFDDWMRESEIQEYIGGYLFPEVAPGWTGLKGEGHYTKGQKNLLNGLRSYLGMMSNR